MRLRRIKAITIKQFASITYNWYMILQFLIYPLIAIFLIFTLPDNIESKISITVRMSIYFVGMIPILAVQSIIKEDQIQNTLRILILSTVKPLEYLIGINIFIVLLSLIDILIFGLLAGFSGIALLSYTGVMLVGVITSLVLGSALAILSSNHTGSSGLITVISLINAFLPVISMANPSFQNFTQIMYTHHIRELICDIFGNYFNWHRFIVIAVNFAIFLILFIVSFKKNRFYDK